MTEKQSVEPEFVFALFLGASAVSIIGMTIPFLFVRPITELHILLLLYALFVLIHAASYNNASILIGFITVILGSVAIDRRSEWVMLYRQHRVLTGFLGSIVTITFLLILGVLIKDVYDKQRSPVVAAAAIRK